MNELTPKSAFLDHLRKYHEGFRLLSWGAVKPLLWWLACGNNDLLYTYTYIPLHPFSSRSSRRAIVAMTQRRGGGDASDSCQNPRAWSLLKMVAANRNVLDHLIGACISQGMHFMDIHLMNVPLSWASLAGMHLPPP